MKNAGSFVKAGEAEIARDKTRGWSHVRELAWGMDQNNIKTGGSELRFSYPGTIYIDGKRLQSKQHSDIEMDSTAPPADMLERHRLPYHLIMFDHPDAANVRMKPYHAKADGETDDTEALQKAIDENEIVFLPRGHYRITRTLKLKSNTKLIGMNPGLTIISNIRDQGDFHATGSPQPVIMTPDDRDAENVVALIKFLGSGNAHPVLWRSGRKSMFYANCLKLENSMLKWPVTVIKGNGGGRWYNLWSGISARPSDEKFCILRAEGTREPLRFYQCNPEQWGTMPAMVVLENCRNVYFYGFKVEATTSGLLVKGCRNVLVSGHGGVNRPCQGPVKAAYVIRDSTNVTLANLATRTRMHEGKTPEETGDPRFWRMVHETLGDGTVFQTECLDRPVLYRSGELFD